MRIEYAETALEKQARQVQETLRNQAKDKDAQSDFKVVLLLALIIVMMALNYFIFTTKLRALGYYLDLGVPRG